MTVAFAIMFAVTDRRPEFESCRRRVAIYPIQSQRGYAVVFQVDFVTRDYVVKAIRADADIPPPTVQLRLQLALSWR